MCALSLMTQKVKARIHSVKYNLMIIKRLIKELVLPDCWKEFDRPDLCHPVFDGDFYVIKF